MVIPGGVEGDDRTYVPVCSGVPMAAMKGMHILICSDVATSTQFRMMRAAGDVARNEHASHAIGFEAARYAAKWDSKSSPRQQDRGR